MTTLPEPLTPAERRIIAAGWRKAARARREAAAVLKAMYRDCLRGRRK